MQPLLGGSALKSSGRLRKRHLPAIYLDPFFFTRYAESAVAGSRRGGDTVPLAELAPTDAPPPPADARASEEKGYAAVVARARAGGGPPLVVSALTLLRWMQEVAPRYRQSDEAGREVANREQTEFAGMRFQSWLNRRFGEALEGLLQVDLQGFTLTAEAALEEVPALAILDGEERCALHALAARHLGCTELATTRPEMLRICELLRASGGPRALLGPAAVLAAMNGE